MLRRKLPARTEPDMPSWQMSQFKSAAAPRVSTFRYARDPGCPQPTPTDPPALFNTVLVVLRKKKGGVQGDRDRPRGGAGRHCPCARHVIRKVSNI